MQHRLIPVHCCLLALGLLGSSCAPPAAGPTSAGGLSIGAIPSGDYSAFGEYFDKHIGVFGVHIFATNRTPNDKVLHAAQVLAQYLDNDEDGSADNASLIAEMTERPGGASLVMFADEGEIETSGVFESDLLDSFRIQDLLGDETHPGGSSAAGGFDATLEEVWHLVSAKGYSGLYPEAFGEQAGSAIADAMDGARGGQFAGVPSSYPSGAWYHYDDVTCDYPCQITEYFYWALTSMLGAQNYPGRCEDIAVEWELCTRDLVESGDPAVYSLLIEPSYSLPLVLPDGSYQSD